MEILETLDRCIALERAAGVIYAVFEERFADDEALRALWSEMADGEREHAHKLSAWRALVAAEPARHRPVATGFDEALPALESVMRNAQARARRVVTAEEAFAIALDLETSELDSLYATLLQASPIARYPDLVETIQHEKGEHHGALIRMVRERSSDEHNVLSAVILASYDAVEMQGRGGRSR